MVRIRRASRPKERWKPTNKETKVKLGIPPFFTIEQTKKFELVIDSLEQQNTRKNAGYPYWTITGTPQSKTVDGSPVVLVEFSDKSRRMSRGTILLVVKNLAGQTVQILQASALTDRNGIASAAFTLPRLPDDKYTANVFAIAPNKVALSGKTSISL